MHSPAPPQAIEPQRLSIHLKLANDEYGAEGETFQLYDVEDAIGAAIEPAGVIEGHEIGKGFFVIFVTGTHPDTLLPMIQKHLSMLRVRSGSFIALRRSDGSETRFPTPP
ncbi:conserved hypothetical protein [Sphingomonas aurantiaca]|uniref:Uncharacterized protein n=1 Tax=Sphingomonas aurantiaca TaxID=185949 RepID=A0A5E7XVX6_9SPHN|nr:hypothetical protein [Sphingomonas aurantiaca]VVS98271.1 conserved hypothetical protein [Sphingomonas aurantiaca]